MKIKKILNIIGLIVIIPVFTMVLISGRGKDPGGKKGPDSTKKGNKVDYANEKVKLEKYKLTLINTFPQPEKRGNFNWPYGENIWSGSESATSLYDSPNQKYYCTLNVVCVQYNYNESVTWVSDPGNPGTMTIDAPTNGSFTILVEYYEPCGAYWTNGSYGRGKWGVLSGVLGYSSGTVLSSWYFVRNEGC